MSAACSNFVRVLALAPLLLRGYVYLHDILGTRNCVQTTVECTHYGIDACIGAVSTDMSLDRALDRWHRLRWMQFQRPARGDFPYLSEKL